jgi:4-hydroxy-tetrahydrodipicolinate reductase
MIGAMTSRYRVIQWATGTVGRQSIRLLADHPEMEIVGAYVTSAAKRGRDVGEIAGLAPLGALATDSGDEICAMNADCVVHTPLPSARAGNDADLDTRMICRLLESGKNVVTVVGYVNPKAYGPDVLARLEAACAKGGTTLHGTGLHPGAIAELLPLTLSPLNTHIDRIVVTEAEEWGSYPSPQIVFEMMGMGKHPDEFERLVPPIRRWMDGLFGESVHLIADGLAAPLDRIDSTLDVEVADDAFEIAAGPVAKGTVVAQRFRWEGIVGGRARIIQECVYRAAPHVVPQWGDVHGVHMKIEGRPGVDVRVGHEVLARGVVATAAHAVHSVPAVVAAAPGIKTFLDLPLVTARYSMR